MFLYDLETGLLYSAMDSMEALWSPDGDWLAFDGADGARVVDADGVLSFRLKPLGTAVCSDLIWNPAADLGGLREEADAGSPSP
jgi:hypothetical protein